jgi:hypothetical protein
MAAYRPKRAPRRYCIVAWQTSGLIAWFWGGHLGWGPSEQAVFFAKEEDAERERMRIKTPVVVDLQSPGVVEVGRFNKKYGKNVVPGLELVR